MGDVISKAANGIGTLLGNAFVAPIKTVFGRSCENMGYYLFHRASVSLQSAETVNGYGALLHKSVGICQCIGKSLCKMCWAACETYWFALEDITCFLWHKLKNTKRVNRRRQHWHHFRDAEVGCSSSEERASLYVDRSRSRGKLIRKRKDRLRSSFYPLRQGSQSRYGIQSHHRHRHHSRLKIREGSVHVKGRSHGIKYSRQLQLRKLNSFQREAALFKKRRFK
ncbi:hypothetical protein U1Q18_006219 [Sarracenia purpurea var. burkii]